MATTFNSEPKKVPTWLILVEGILAIIVGAIFLIRPLSAAISLVFVIGVFWLVDGIFDIVSIFRDRSNWGWKLFMGIIGIMAGLFLVRTPIIGAVTLSKFYIIMMGVLGIIYGAMALFNGLRGGGMGAVAIGLVSIVLGIFLLANSWWAVLALPFMIGAFTVVGGISAVIFALRNR